MCTTPPLSNRAPLCEFCSDWARTGQRFLTKHHPDCAMYNPEEDAREIIGMLLDKMKLWGSEEDGVPDDYEIADAYNTAAITIGVERLKDA